MNGEREPGTLPIRRWLALALLLTFLIPVCVTIVFVGATVRGNPHDKHDRAADQIRREASRWHDPEWQEATRADLADEDIWFILFEGGDEIYRSVADPLGGPDGSGGTHLIDQVVVPDSNPQQIAYVVTDEDVGPPDELPVEYVPFIALTALGLTLAGIAWFLGRTMLRPLAATSEAARRIAGGDLNITLPRSRVREVAEVNQAFESMSAALRRSLEEQAQVEEERRFFIGAVAHYLRTPLFALRGYLEGLESGVATTPEQQARYIAIAREKADALERLISDLFDFSRLEYLDQTPQREPLDLADLLAKLVEEMQPLAESRGVAVALSANSTSCHVSGDRHLLTRVIVNLLDNALYFTPSGGRVDVDCHATPTGVAFTIADSGPGIPAEDLPHLFTPLYRGETSRNRRTGGAGLGLTIARRILVSHGGDLAAANRPEGGAIFTGTLPRDA